MPTDGNHGDHGDQLWTSRGDVPAPPRRGPSDTADLRPGRRLAQRGAMLGAQLIAQRVVLFAALLIALLLPATALAQSDPGLPKSDSARRAPDDSGPGAAATTAAAAATAALRDTGDAEPSDTADQVVEIKNGRVTLHVSDLPLADALRMLTEPVKKNVIVAAGVQGTVTASMYRVTFEDALKAMLVSNGLAYYAEGDFIYVHTQEEMDKLNASRRKLASRVFKLTYLNAAAAKSLIEPLISSAGKVAVTPPAKTGLGGQTGLGDTEGDSVASSDKIIVTDYEDNLEKIARVLSDLDTTPTQVLIEATILRATLNEDNALGIDFTTVGGVDFAAVSSVSPAAQSVATGNIPTAELENTNYTFRTDFNNALPSGGFTFGILKDQVGVFLRALEAVTDTEILANPKILALNKQVGQVIVGRRDGYLTTTITETTAIQTVEFLETGTVLTFRPYVAHDGWVRMEIHPKDSTGGLTEANLPFEQTTEVTTNVLVRDGHTILIGGLFREVSTAARGQVPLLGNIPVAGALFRRTRDTTVREEVIVLLTVHVLKGDMDNKAAKELGEDIERFRVGQRAGLQWIGRERLGEAHYRWAMDHLARGDTDKALWDAELALCNYPRHIEAMKLKEKILGKRAWESEASSIRHFVVDRIEEEAGEDVPPFGRPAPPFQMPEGAIVPDDFNGPSGVEESLDGEGDLAEPEPAKEVAP